MQWLDYLNPIKIYVLFTFIMILLFRDKGKKAHNILFYILLLSVANEALSMVLRYHSIPIRLNNSIFITANNLLWFWILYTLSSLQKSLFLPALSFFIGFILYNFFFLDGIKEFTVYSFVTGSLLYVVLFIYNSFSELKKENLNYFLSNDYILIFAPVLFFIGFSLLFGFNNKSVYDIVLVGSIKLYDFISYFANIVYYSLLNIYIYREKQLKYAS